MINDKLFKKTLYYDSNGSANPTLNDDETKFSKMEITYSRTGLNKKTEIIDKESYNGAVLNIIDGLADISRIYYYDITISNKHITRNQGRYVNFPHNTSAYNVGSDSSLTIYKVVGYY